MEIIVRNLQSHMLRSLAIHVSCVMCPASCDASTRPFVDGSYCLYLPERLLMICSICVILFLVTWVVCKYHVFCVFSLTTRPFADGSSHKKLVRTSATGHDMTLL